MMAEQNRSDSVRVWLNHNEKGIAAQKERIHSWLAKHNAELIWDTKSCTAISRVIDSVECWALGAGSVIVTFYITGTVDLHSTCPDEDVEACIVDAELRCLVAEEKNTR